jgi:prepilin signal peptidase PulO-like enzyme (type II secretory pathway)
MIAMAVYDLRWMELPDKFNWPFVLSGVLSMAVLAQIDPASANSHLLAAAAGWSFFALMYYGSGGKWLGGGDVKFALGMGAWLGLSLVLTGLALSFYVASFVMIPLLILKVVKRRQPVPFGPFLIAGTIIAMLYGQNLIDWYSRNFLYVL